MNKHLKVSVIVVSQNRGTDLSRLLLSLRYQTVTSFEIIVVTNLTIADYCPKTINPKSFHHIDFQQENISAARNIGINAASGEIIAFIDDDAIPEPLWLQHLIGSFKNPDVGISGGFVRGRNGISFQWQGIETDTAGEDYELAISEPLTRGLLNGRFLKAQGTNIAFRKTALLAIGGFDEVFEFYLDETDVCLRLAKAGWLTVIVPKAQVIHGYSESKERRIDRAPKSLKSLGRSKFLFLRKHVKQNEISRELKKFEEHQRMRLLEFMVSGLLEPRDIPHLLQSFWKGVSEAQSVNTIATEISENGLRFRPYITQLKSPRVLYSSIWKKRKLREKAMELSKSGIAVQCFCLSRSTLFHRRKFDSEGFWIQTGGIFGRSIRAEPMFQFLNTGLSKRASKEFRSLAEIFYSTAKIEKLN